jgi:hypothetical protein
MKKEQDLIQDIADMRSMMERSSKFLSLSGLAGIMAGIYALIGAFVAYQVFEFNPGEIQGDPISTNIVLLGLLVLVLALGTAVFLSWKKAKKNGEKFYNSTARRLMSSMAVPLVTGGILALLLVAHGLIGLVAPCTMIFYGLSQYNASKVSYDEMQGLGLIMIALGLLGSYFVEFGLLCWALGFGLVHIVYGIYLHYRYER